MKKIFDGMTQNDIAIYGNFRYCNDFKYVFQLVLSMYFSNVFYAQESDCIYRELKKLCEQYRLVIACINKETWCRIKDAQLTNVIWMEELFGLLDEINVGWFDKVNPSDEYHRIPENKKVALWGLNDACDFFLQYQKNIVPVCILDRDLSKSGAYHGITVMMPDDIKDWNDYYVIIMCRDRYSVRDWLISKGMKETEDFLFYGYYIDRYCVSEMMRKTIYAPSKRKINCELPFRWATFGKEGVLNLCCCANMVVGNILHQDIANVWKSAAAVIIRLSMINQTYSFCESEMCQLYPLSHLENDSEPSPKAYDRETFVNPKILVLDSSDACNLYCETCRTCVRPENQLQKFRRMQIMRRVIPSFDYADKILFAGDGEILISESYQYILNNMKELHHNGLIWDIVSNGNLMAKDRIDYILAMGGEDTRICVSVDAANKETYQIIRRGGNWERLMKNLLYIGQQREKGNLAIFRLNFVVQSKNVREMGEFVELARRLNANEVWFTEIRNWGTYNNEDFGRIDVRDENGNIKTEYKEYFENPILKSKEVRMSALLTGKDANIDI